MKIPDLPASALTAAIAGDLASIDAMLIAIQPGVFNLAVRMLGNRDDAADATQEILLKVVTHLASFRAQSAFSTWVFQIARNHLLTAITRSKENPEVSLDSIAERLQQGIDYAVSVTRIQPAEKSLSPEDHFEARQIALGCTQSIIMALDREQRLAYVLDTAFGLSSELAAEVLGIQPAAYRKRLSRVRETLEPFFSRTCGLVNADADCQCERQLPAKRALARSAAADIKPISLRALHRSEIAHIEAHFDNFIRMSNAAAVLRAHPDYRAPESMVHAIRRVLETQGHWGGSTAARTLQ
jgi:RNA polymerase sigma factor (sigma-70 family)